MNDSKLRRQVTLAHLGVAATLSACGGAVGSGVAVGTVGRGISEHTSAVPRGAERCALEAAVPAPQPGAPEPPAPSAACSKAQTSDELWRRAMVALAAYGDTLGTIASGDKNDSSGQVQAALTGVKGSSWIEVDDSTEKGARDAVTALVNVTSEAGTKDLDKTIQDAAPHVKKICSGLDAYLATQAEGFAKIQSETEANRSTRNDRRCGTIDNKGFCVTDSMSDRVTSAHMYGHLAHAEASHLDARDAVAAFCAAHEKLQGAAGTGDLSKDETQTAIADAVKSSRRARPKRQPAAKK